MNVLLRKSAKGFSLAFVIFFCSFFSFHQGFGKSDLDFLENKGQWPDAVLYRAEIPDGRIFLKKNAFVYHFQKIEGQYEHHHPLQGKISGHVLSLNFKNASEKVQVVSYDSSSAYYNFFIGNDPSHWASRVRGFKKIRYKELYQNIDLKLWGKEGYLKYNFYVRNGGDAEKITLSYEGTGDLVLKNGDLEVHTSVNTFMELKPFAFQKVNGKEKAVPCHFRLNGNEFTFSFPEGYDRSKTLVIDPKIVFATYSGSNSDNWGFTGTFDQNGNGYSGGTVYGPKFITTTGAYQDTFGGGVDTNGQIGDLARDIAILKYSPDGTQLKYGTYLGGEHNEQPHSMIVNSKGELLIFGTSYSKDFPVTLNAYDTGENGEYDIIVSKLSSDGTKLLASTYVGGKKNDGLNGYYTSNTGKRYLNYSKVYYNYGDVYRGEIIVDSFDNVYLATSTESSDFPVTSGVFQTSFKGSVLDACVFKLNKDLTRMQWSTFLGGSSDDAAYSINLDSKDNVLVSGGTVSNDFYKDTSTFQSGPQGGVDGFVTHIKKDGTQILRTTFFGTSSYDQVFFVRSDPDDNVYVTGQTKDSSFYVENVNYFEQGGKQFIAKFDPALDSLVYSTVFGSGRKHPDLSPAAFMVDKCQRVYFSGWGGKTNNYGKTGGLTITQNAYQKTTDGSDFYVAVFARDIDTILYATYFGGNISEEHVDGGTSRFDENSIIYQSVCAGCGGNSDLPTYPNNVHSSTNNSFNCNNALLKIDLNVPDIFARFNAPQNTCVSDTVWFNNTSRLAKTYFWKFGDGDTSTKFEPVHHYQDTGLYQVSLIVKHPLSCKVADTFTRNIRIYDQAIANFIDSAGPCSDVREFYYKGTYGNSFSWNFGDSSYSDAKDPVHRYSDTGKYTVRLIVDSGTVCESRSSGNIRINGIARADFNYRIDTCAGEVTFNNLYPDTGIFRWNFGDSTFRVKNNSDTVIHVYQESGDFDVQLVANRNTVCADSVSKTVSLESPMVRFDFKVIDPCSYSVKFYNLSSFTQNSTWYLGNDTVKDKDTFVHQFTGPGYIPVKLTAQGQNKICHDSQTRVVILDTLPYAAFNFSTPACSAQIKFNNNSGYAKDYRWQIRDQQGLDTIIRGRKDLRYFFSQSRKDYYVSLWVNNSTNCPDSIEKSLFLDSAADARFGIDLDTCSRTARFKNNSTAGSYLWRFGDGTTSSDSLPVHVYASGQGYFVDLIVRDKGCTDTLTRTVILGKQPEAAFIYRKEECSPKVQFQNQSQYANSYSWEFGDGQTSRDEHPEHIFPRQDSFKVRLIAGVGDPCPDTSIKKIFLDTFAFAGFTYDLDSCEGFVRFHNLTDSAGDYFWDFGDGKTSNKASPQHLYKDTGLFKVTRRVRNGSCRDTFTREIRIVLPFAGINFHRDSCSPVVQFRSVSTKARKYVWYFGDGDSSHNKAPGKKYRNKGNYRVRLVVNPLTRCADTADTTLNVGPFVYPEFSVSPSGCEREVRFINESENAGTFTWDFGDGEQSNKDTPVHRYRNNGDYLVSLIAHNAVCQDTFQKQVKIDKKISAGLSVKKMDCEPRVILKTSVQYPQRVKWLFGDGTISWELNPVHEYSRPGKYRIRLILNPGEKCVDTLEIHAIITEEDFDSLTIPNLFTPNGDGYNDKFIVSTSNECSKYELEVYNRWGQLLRSDKGQKLIWDGSYEGKIVAPGTYYYIIRGRERTLTGTITLVQ